MLEISEGGRQQKGPRLLLFFMMMTAPPPATILKDARCAMIWLKWKGIGGWGSASIYSASGQRLAPASFNKTINFIIYMPPT